MNKWFIGLLFLLSTCFFLFQHSTGLSWDFTVYYLNSRYFLTGQGFYEWIRPPLASVFMFFGEYLYIILVSLLGLFACLKFAKTYDLKPEVLYAFFLSPYVLIVGFHVGTEFLMFSLTFLFFAYIKTELSGLFYGLLVLTHYTNASNIVFLFFNKRLLKSLIIAFLVLTPWFLFNYSLKGDPFYSMLNQYALNVPFREAFLEPLDPYHFFFVMSFTIPFFIYGLYNFRKQSIDYFMILFFIFKISTYLFIPYKIPRFLVGIMVPVAYFCARGVERLNHRVAYLILGLTLAFLPFYAPNFGLEDPAHYFPVLDVLSNNSCMVLSNAWVFLNYYGVRAGPAPWFEMVNNALSDGYTLVYFYHIADPPYVFNQSFMHSFPVLYESDTSIILFNDSVCVKPYDYNVSFIEEVDMIYRRSRNQSFSFTILDLFS